MSAMFSELTGRIVALERRLDNLILPDIGGWFWIMEETLPGGDGTVTFNNIPGHYRHLAVAFQARSDVAAEGDFMLMRFNNDAGANYDHMRKYADANNTFTATGAIGGNEIYIAIIEGNTARANNFAPSIIYVQGYALTDREKWAWCSNSGRFGDVSALADMYIADCRGRWKISPVEAITRIDLFPQAGTNFKQHSRFELYGIL